MSSPTYYIKLAMASLLARRALSAQASAASAASGAKLGLEGLAAKVGFYASVADFDERALALMLGGARRWTSRRRAC